MLNSQHYQLSETNKRTTNSSFLKYVHNFSTIWTFHLHIVTLSFRWSHWINMGWRKTTTDKIKTFQV